MHEKRRTLENCIYALMDAWKDECNRPNDELSCLVYETRLHTATQIATLFMEAIGDAYGTQAWDMARKIQLREFLNERKKVLDEK